MYRVAMFSLLVLLTISATGFERGWAKLNIQGEPHHRICIFAYPWLQKNPQPWTDGSKQGESAIQSSWSAGWWWSRAAVTPQGKCREINHWEFKSVWVGAGVVKVTHKLDIWGIIRAAGRVYQQSWMTAELLSHPWKAAGQVQCHGAG